MQAAAILVLAQEICPLSIFAVLIYVRLKIHNTGANLEQILFLA